MDYKGTAPRNVACSISCASAFSPISFFHARHSTLRHGSNDFISLDTRVSPCIQIFFLSDSPPCPSPFAIPHDTNSSFPELFPLYCETLIEATDATSSLSLSLSLSYAFLLFSSSLWSHQIRRVKVLLNLFHARISVLCKQFTFVRWRLRNSSRKYKNLPSMLHRVHYRIW